MTLPPQDPYRPQPMTPPGEGGYGAPQRRGGLFPIPHRSWQTRRGTHVTVGGCCLPLPIGCLAVVGSAALVGGRALLQARQG